MAGSASRSTALWVVRRLREAGFQALFAGGCVRDMLLRRPSADYDVATDATPQQVKGLFRRVLLVGAKFGVAMVIHKGRRVEVVTFRSDLSYSDGRRPDGVRFTTAREDALRRDFTINGMFYDPVARKVIDHVGGRRDLRMGVVQTIGRPEDRFGEDYLRMVRAVRFAVRFGFRLDRATAAAIRRHAPKITAISGERIADELSKMLAEPSAGQALRMLRRLGLARHVLPEMFEPPGAWERAVDRVAAVARHKDLVGTFGGLLAGLRAASIGRIVRRGGQSNELRDSLKWMSRHVDDWRRAAEMPLADFKRLLASPNYTRLERLWGYEERRTTGKSTCKRRIAQRRRGIPSERIAPPPLVTGTDLKALGLADGPAMGKVLRLLYDAQLNEQVATRAEAMKLAQREMARGTGGAL